MYLAKLWNKLFTYLFFTARPVLKWFLHRFTCLCELQRICYGVPSGSRRAKAIENSLAWSRTPEIRALTQSMDEVVSRELTNEEFTGEVVERALETVVRVKKISKKANPDFERLFETCVEQIWGYRRLMNMVESRRRIQYQSDNAEHEQKLMQLWKILMPDTKLEGRITKQWQDIGFQGDDPKTDFRGMGILGLENLLFFATEYTSAARHALSHSMHPQHGYTFAIVGINLTAMAINLLKQGHAKTHIYNAIPSYASLNTFHHLYSYLFFAFDKYWLECKPESIMDFSMIQERFNNDIRAQLGHDATVLRINLAVDTI